MRTGRRRRVFAPFFFVPPLQHVSTSVDLECERLIELNRAHRSILRANAAVKPHDSAGMAVIIDDEPAIRNALRQFFSRRGWTVEEASDGAAGLALLAQYGERIDLVISDLRMPGFSGFRLHDQLMVEQPDLLARIVFTTGDAMSGEAAGFVSRTRCTVLQKPFQLGTLDQIIARLQTA